MDSDLAMLARPADPVAGLIVWCTQAATGLEPSSAPRPIEPPLLGMDDQHWSRFLREAGRHMVYPLCWRALEPFSAWIPALIAEDLRTAFDSNTRRNLRLSAELVSLLGKLSAAGVEAVPWKGPLLAERGYGDLRLRQFFDLDVLLRSADLGAARDVLRAAGFTPEKPMTEAQQATYVEHQGELEMVRESDGLWVELHTQIVPTYYGRGTSSEELWHRVGNARVARAMVRALDPVDELEALCVHGSKHRWDRLAWIADVAVMGRLLEEDDWQRLLRGAREHGTRRMVSLGLLLAGTGLGAPLPSIAWQAAHRDKVARSLAMEVTARLFDPRPSRFDALLFHAKMRERSRDRLSYLVSVLFTPSGADWATLALPRSLFPLYVLLRPLRLAVKYGRRAIARPPRVRSA